MARYEIRKDGRVLAQSSIPNLGYSAALLRQMELDGYQVLIDGKPRPKRTRKPDSQELNPPG